MSASSSGVLGLDRKAMEEERLKRLALKRGAPLGLEHERATKVQKQAPEETTRAMPQQTKVEYPPIEELSSQVSASSNKDKGGLQYPRGVVKRTWVFGQVRKNDIKIEEVLQKTELKVAVLSSFQWDMEWVFSKVNVTNTKLVLIMQAKDSETKAQYQRESAGWSRTLRLCFPPMPGQVFCMHSKLMLLFYEKYLRVVVPTANLISFDWGETGVMENSVFLIDLPRIMEVSNKSATTPFAKELHHFLDAMGLDQDVRNAVKKFDFAETQHLAFVHTIGGSHTGEASKQTGYPLVAESVKRLGLRCSIDEPLQVAFATSSVGALTDGQLEALYNALRGKDPVMPTAPPRAKSKAASSVEPMQLPPGMRSLKDRFHILFPSSDTVKKSIGGPPNGGSICMSSNYWDNVNFPKSCMHEYTSSRPGVLSHNKIILARTPNKAFYYVGSANISQSAWGSMVYDRTTKSSKLNARNWECGVLVPVVLPPTSPSSNSIRHVNASVIDLTEDDDGPTGVTKSTAATSDEESTESETDTPQPTNSTKARVFESNTSINAKTQPRTQSTQILPMSVFASSIDIPFKWPAESYTAGQRPWFFNGDAGGSSA